MTTIEFDENYWCHYIMLEKEFSELFEYISLDIENEETFSHAYSKLILEVGSEVDVTLRQYCKILNSNFKGKSIGVYKNCIQTNEAPFFNQSVQLIRSGRNIYPWNSWVALDGPWWWTAYNKIKHNRTTLVEVDGIKKEAYRFGNQKYVLEALAGLYQILIYTYYHLAQTEGKDILTPMPGSRVFKLTGGIWDSIHFFDEVALFVDDKGCMHIEISKIHY